MAASQLIEKCCKHHVDARTKSIRLEISITSARGIELTEKERDCLYACNGYNFQCPEYIEYKEVLLCVLSKI